MGDVEIQMLEQQRLIEQLKDMIRERDEEAKKKDHDLKVNYIPCRIVVLSM